MMTAAILLGATLAIGAGYYIRKRAEIGGTVPPKVLGIATSVCLPESVSYMFGKTLQSIRSGALDATLPISTALCRLLPRNGTDVGICGV